MDDIKTGVYKEDEHRSRAWAEQTNTLPPPPTPTNLLHAGNVARDVLDRHGILDGQAVALALDARLVDQDTPIRGEAW
jgi:hypothetical protein